MTEIETVLLARKIIRDRRELAITIIRASPANNLAHGSSGNLTRLAMNIEVMGHVLRSNKTNWYKFCKKHSIQEDGDDHNGDYVHPEGYQFGNTDGGH